MEEQNILGYFGPYKIARAEVIGKTDGGDELLCVLFEGKEGKLIIAKRALVEATTAELIDLTHLRNHRYEKLVERLRKECVESGVGFDDIDFVTKELNFKLNDHFELMVSTFLKKPHYAGESAIAGMTVTEAYEISKRNLSGEAGA